MKGGLKEIVTGGVEERVDGESEEEGGVREWRKEFMERAESKGRE